MTADKCHRLSGQLLRHCEAYMKAGLTVSQITNQEIVDRIGLSRAEDKALEDHYRTSLEPMEDCSPGCPLCHKGLPRERWD